MLAWESAPSSPQPPRSLHARSPRAPRPSHATPIHQVGWGGRHWRKIGREAGCLWHPDGAFAGRLPQTAFAPLSGSHPITHPSSPSHAAIHAAIPPPSPSARRSPIWAFSHPPLAAKGPSPGPQTTSGEFASSLHGLRRGRRRHRRHALGAEHTRRRYTPTVCIPPPDCSADRSPWNHRLALVGRRRRHPFNCVNGPRRRVVPLESNFTLRRPAWHING